MVNSLFGGDLASNLFTGVLLVALLFRGEIQALLGALWEKTAGAKQHPSADPVKPRTTATTSAFESSVAGKLSPVQCRLYPCTKKTQLSTSSSCLHAQQTRTVRFADTPPDLIIPTTSDWREDSSTGVSKPIEFCSLPDSFKADEFSLPGACKGITEEEPRGARKRGFEEETHDNDTSETQELPTPVDANAADNSGVDKSMEPDELRDRHPVPLLSKSPSCVEPRNIVVLEFDDPSQSRRQRSISSLDNPNSMTAATLSWVSLQVRKKIQHRQSSDSRGSCPKVLCGYDYDSLLCGDSLSASSVSTATARPEH